MFATNESVQTDPRWRHHVPLHAYCHGDTGAGVGASHQTGWMGLVAKLLEQTSRGQAGAAPNGRVALSAARGASRQQGAAQ